MSEHQSEQQQMTPNLKPHVRPKTVGTGKNAPPQITIIYLGCGPCQEVCIEIKGQLVRVGFPPYVFQGSNTGCQAWFKHFYSKISLAWVIAFHE